MDFIKSIESNIVITHPDVLVNLILLYEDGRLCYRFDRLSYDINPLLKIFKDSGVEFITIPITSEPLMTLERNLRKVYTILESSKEIDKVFGLVLDYSYTGPNWNAQLTQCYTISFQYTSEKYNGYVYSYNIPISEYSDVHKEHILDKIDVFNSILNKYGFTVFGSAMTFSGGVVEYIDLF